MGILDNQFEVLGSHFEALCPECNGNGHLGNKGCFHCDSTGYIQDSQPSYSMKYDNDTALCTSCNGQGHIGNRECTECDATGLSDGDHYQF